MNVPSINADCRCFAAPKSNLCRERDMPMRGERLIPPAQPDKAATVDQDAWLVSVVA
jgi:hypothetical protein